MILPLLCSCAPTVKESQVSLEESYSTLLSRDNPVTRQLLRQYDEWKHTPYRKGGLSKKGIDCSGFVHLTFRTRLGRDVARSTRALVKTGIKISATAILPGDLLFFKTGLQRRHVGIYLGEGQFLHASTSRGVIISSLREDYWKKHFWQARRILT